MIPAGTEFLEEDFEVEEESSKTYRMDKGNQAVCGKIDGLEAMEQVIFKILNTERYQYLIYSWDYGIELLDLFGEPLSYVCPELERRVTEALLQDSRVEGADGFEFEASGNMVKAMFTVHTIFGGIQAEKELEI